MNGIPYDRIAAAALSQVESLLFQWFPAGVVDGHEFKIGDIHGTPGESLSVNMRTGAWADFAGDIRGGDLTALFAAKYHGGKQGPAACELAKDLGIEVNGYSNGHANGKASGHVNGRANGVVPQPTPKPGKAADDWKPMVPPPEHAKPPGDAAFRGLDHVHKYTSLDGKPTHYVLRIDAKNGQKKQVRPLTFGSLNGKEGWCKMHPANPLPLYGLHKLAEKPNADVILHEGEKKCDAGQRLFPEFIHMAWPRGAENVDCADFEPLKDRGVKLLWPDADAAGAKAAKKILAKLNVAYIVNTEGLPEKFDCADLLTLTETGQVADAKAWLKPRVVKVEPPPEPQEDDAAGSDEDADDRHGEEGEPGLGMGLTGKGARKGINEAIAKLNEKYFVVNEAGKTVIYRPEFDHILKRHSYSRMTFGDFKNLFMNKAVHVGTDAAGSPTYKGVSDVWLRSPRRREYPGGITFDPSGRQEDGKLNLWRGFAIEPKPGDWSLMQDHMLTILCRGNKGHYEHLLDRLARMVQFPGEAGQIAIVLKSGEGAGKGIVAEPFKRIFGQHAMTVTQPSHLVGHFNAHLRDCVFLFADEAFFAGDRAHNRVLKRIVTEKTLEIEGKGQNIIVAPNFLHVMMASNDDWVVPASLDSRRFFVLVLSEARKGDRAYFKAIADQMEHHGGDAAMLHNLLHRDISEFDPRQAPVTEGLAEQRTLSLKGPDAWWMDVLHRGYVYRSKLGLEKHFGVWHEWVSKDVLFDSYTEFAKQARERDIMSREMLGRFMVRMKCKGARPGEGIVGEHMTDVDNIYGGTTRKAVAWTDYRPRGYNVDTLDAARAAFEDVTGLKIDWDDDVPHA